LQAVYNDGIVTRQVRIHHIDWIYNRRHIYIYNCRHVYGYVCV